jgi:hypothetical protein
MTKVKLEVIKMWVRERLFEILKSEDEVLIGTIENMLEEVCFFWSQHNFSVNCAAFRLSSTKKKKEINCELYSENLNFAQMEVEFFSFIPCPHAHIIHHTFQRSPDPKNMQIYVTGFLERKAGPFMSELWALLVSAMENDGIPKEILEKKKEELRQKKVCYFLLTLLSFFFFLFKFQILPMR